MSSNSLPENVDLGTCLSHVKTCLYRYANNENISQLQCIKLKAELDMWASKVFQATQCKPIICKTKGCINLNYTSLEGYSSEYCERCQTLISIYGDIDGFEVHKP